MKKVIVLAICLIFLFATGSFAGDVIFSPVIKAPEPGEMDTYIIANSDGSSKAVHVMSLDTYGDDTYLVIDGRESTVIFKVD